MHRFGRRMAKHLYFWLGVFAATLLAVPVALGAWGAATETARNAAAFLFGVIATLVLLLVLVLLFRDTLLRKVLRLDEATLDEVAARVIGLGSAVARRDADAAGDEAAKLARTAAGWWAWGSFYRWVIGTALAFLLAFGAFTGTVLLFEQTRKLSEQIDLMQAQTDLMSAQTERLTEQTLQSAMQSEISGLSLVSELRTQMLSTIEEMPLIERLTRQGIPGTGAPVLSDPAGKCRFGLRSDRQLRSVPSPSMLLAIADLGRREPIGARVVTSLKHLTRDADGAVVLGAVIILDMLGETAPERVKVQNVFVDDIKLNGEFDLEFDTSFARGLICRKCSLTFWRSLVLGPAALRISGGANISMSWLSEQDSLGGVLLVGRRGTAPESAAPVMLGEIFKDISDTGYVTDTAPNEVCQALRDMTARGALISEWD